MHSPRHDSFTSERERKSSDATVCAKTWASVEVVPQDVETPVLPVATKDNDWLGFCPSAAKLQNGDKKDALKKRTDYSASFAASGLTTYYCSTRSCCFQGHTSVDFVWKNVMKDENLGVKCRWAFLAKSHTKQTNVQNKQYHFQCPICIYTQGHAEGRIWKGISIFMDHVSTHRAKDLSAEVLQKLNIINDHAAEEREDFDLNLIPPQKKRKSQERDTATAATTPPQTTPPLTRTTTRGSIAESIWSRKASSVLDLGSGFSRSHTMRSDRADSLLTVVPLEEDEAECRDVYDPKPWSDGLSDFKMDREEDYFSPDF